MMAIRDMYCTACGEEKRDLVCEHVEALPCDRCRAITEHRDTCRCRGGHYHFNDFGTVPLEEMCRYEGAGATEGGDGRGFGDHSKPVTDLRTGKVYQNDPKYSADARAERSARAKHRREKRAGRGRIYGPTSGLQRAKA